MKKYEDRVIFNTIFGSRLYGTATENSDIDTKIIYLPTYEDLITAKDVMKSYRTEHNNLDIESFSIHKFLKLASEGQTMALDMLFSNNYLTYDNDIWETHIIPNREKFITKRIKTFISFAVSQARRYSNKGNTYNTYNEAINFFNNYRPHTKIVDVVGNIGDMFKYSTSIAKDKRSNLLEIGHLKFTFGSTISSAIECLNRNLKKYGGRATASAENNGVDYKALSHALRTVREAEELVDYRKITFPLISKEEIKKVKYGNIDIDYFIDYLEDETTRVEEKINNSDLPDESTDIDNIIINIYN